MRNSRLCKIQLQKFILIFLIAYGINQKYCRRCCIRTQASSIYWRLRCRQWNRFNQRKLNQWNQSFWTVPCSSSFFKVSFTKMIYPIFLYDFSYKPWQNLTLKLNYRYGRLIFNSDRTTEMFNNHLWFNKAVPRWLDIALYKAMQRILKV